MTHLCCNVIYKSITLQVVYCTRHQRTPNARRDTANTPLFVWHLPISIHSDSQLRVSMLRALFNAWFVCINSIISISYDIYVQNIKLWICSEICCITHWNRLDIKMDSCQKPTKVQTKLHIAFCTVRMNRNWSMGTIRADVAPQSASHCHALEWFGKAQLIITCLICVCFVCFLFF